MYICVVMSPIQVMASEPIVLRPEQTTYLRVTDLSETIVQNLVKFGSVDMVGISSAMFIACGAVNLARNIANVNVKSLAIDYIDIPIVGKFEGVFFELTKEPGIDFKKQIDTYEIMLNQNGGGFQKTVGVSKKDRPEKLTSIALMKLSKFPMIKISGAGVAINTAISIALQLAKANIARKKVGIRFVGLDAIPQKIDRTKTTTALQIYLQQDYVEPLGSHHLSIIEKIKGK